MRDGMTGALNMSAVMEVAKLQGLKKDNLLDFIEFVNEMETEYQIKKNADKK